MPAPAVLFRALGALALSLPPLAAQAAPGAGLISLETPAAFRPLDANWTLAGGVAGNPRRDKHLTATPGTGMLICNPGAEKERRGHLFSAWDHGDLELELEFLLTPGSNSGVYLQGRYEVQLFDSWGVRELRPHDCGSIYPRWDPARGKGREAYDGHLPRTNACRPPGLWQTLRIEFQAPRFDASGRKTGNARFTKVVLNGITVHENVEVTGPTREAAFADEQPLGPLMIQGDHGPVALRQLRVHRAHTR